MLRIKYPVMKGIIVYKGKYGATAQYASWLGIELQIPVIKLDDITIETLLCYDYIIMGSSVYVGKLQARAWIAENSDILQEKKVFFFIVCATPEDRKDKIAEIIKNNIPASLNTEHNVFIMRGRMIMAKLSRLDRFMLKMGARLQKNPAERKRMLQDFDEVKPGSIVPLLKSVQSLNSKLADLPDNLHCLV